MRSFSTKAALVGVALLVAIALALLSVKIQRTGPELVQYGNLCGQSFSEPCYQPVLKGGFPFAYLFDTPGISREHQLAFLEDTVRPVALAFDIAVYFTIILIATAVVARRQWARLRNTDRASA